MTPEVFDYSPQPKRRLPFRLTTSKVIVLCILLIALVTFLRGGLLSSADIRLDTGDLRYRYLGLPLFYERTSEPERSQLLALASNSKVLRPDWHTCAKFPLHGSNNPVAMCRGWYFRANIWAAQDPQLARLMLEDVANYIKATNATQGLPASSIFLSGLFVETNSKGWFLKQGWRQDDELLVYTRSKSYTLPTTATSQ
jgi:hypothetical protein